MEVDYIEGYDPRNYNTSNGSTVLDAAEKNLRLYGFDITFTVNGSIPIQELRNTCKAIKTTNYVGATTYEPCWDPDHPGAVNITPHELNRWELDVFEDSYHDDERKLHVLWGTRMGNDLPKTMVDERLDYDKLRPCGIAFVNGAPGTNLWDDVSGNDFGYVVLDGELGSFSGCQSVAHARDGTYHWDWLC